jgi:hypothetical protein
MQQKEVAKTESKRKEGNAKGAARKSEKQNKNVDSTRTSPVVTHPSTIRA